MIKIFRKCKDELGTTIVMVTHEVEVARLADRIIHIKMVELQNRVIRSAYEFFTYIRNL